MEEYIIRIIKERDELREKFEKLNSFLNQSVKPNLTEYQLDLLYRQRNIMRDYLEVLTIRIGNEIKLEK